MLLLTPVTNDCKAIYNWIREIADTTARSPQSEKAFIKLEDLQKFYREKLVAESTDPEEFKYLSEEGFHCYQSFFVLINSLDSRLIKVTEGYGIYVPKQENEETGSLAKPEGDKDYP